MKLHGILGHKDPQLLRQAGGMPKLCVSPKSPRYFSSLLSGRQCRMRLIYSQSGFSSFVAWRRARPDEVFAVRNLILIAISLVQTRHQMRVARLPWVLLSIGDRRRPRQERLRIASSFSAMPTCCCPHGMARTLKTDNEGIQHL